MANIKSDPSNIFKYPTIGTETTCNLEPEWACISERLGLPIEACTDGSNEDMLTTTLISFKAPYSNASSGDDRCRSGDRCGARWHTGRRAKPGCG